MNLICLGKYSCSGLSFTLRGASRGHRRCSMTRQAAHQSTTPDTVLDQPEGRHSVVLSLARTFFSLHYTRRRAGILKTIFGDKFTPFFSPPQQYRPFFQKNNKKPPLHQFYWGWGSGFSARLTCPSRSKACTRPAALICGNTTAQGPKVLVAWWAAAHTTRAQNGATYKMKLF